MKHSSIFVALALLGIGISASSAQASDAKAGKKIAKKCTVCHTLNKGGKNKLGPNLYGILYNPVGKVKGYKYSKAFSKADFKWNEHNFIEFVTKPKKFVKGTKMGFRGLKDSSQRADLLAYFKTLEDETGGNKLVGDVERGKRVARKVCTICHTFEKGGKVVYGPNLFDIYGKEAAKIPGYKYSKALAKSGLVWNDKNLGAFLSNPEQFVKGTKARFPGIKSEKDKVDLLAYLKTLK